MLCEKYTVLYMVVKVNDTKNISLWPIDNNCLRSAYVNFTDQKYIGCECNIDSMQKRQIVCSWFSLIQMNTAHNTIDDKNSMYTSRHTIHIVFVLCAHEFMVILLYSFLGMNIVKPKSIVWTLVSSFHSVLFSCSLVVSYVNSVQLYKHRTNISSNTLASLE